jgi:proteic killer suppression protein
MEISFATPRLRATCESESKLQREHGRPCAKKLRARLADLEAASTLAAVRQLPGRCHELDGDRKGQLSIELSGALRLILEPTLNPPPMKDDGGLSWEAVDAVRILEIVDYH